jgi:hypothetical protein
MAHPYVLNDGFPLAGGSYGMDVWHHSVSIQPTLAFQLL